MIDKRTLGDWASELDSLAQSLTRAQPKGDAVYSPGFAVAIAEAAQWVEYAALLLREEAAQYPN